MKIKVKLSLGIGLLFLLIAFLGIFSVVRVNSMASETKNILVANHNTLEYSRMMLKALDEIGTEKSALERFELNLKKQESNITEPGEREITESLTEHFALLKEDPSNAETQKRIRMNLNEIMRLNMSAIEIKSGITTITANKTVWGVSIAGTFSLIVAFILLTNLPGSIANPIKELTESIKQIAAKNYSQRVHFENHDEFGDLAESFNVMAKKLEEYNNSNLARLMMEKKRLETLINNMNEPVIGLDEEKKLIFINEEALKITGLKLEEVIGKPSQNLSVNNDLIRTLLQSLEENGKPNGKPLKIYANGKESYFEKEILSISIIPTGEDEKKLVGYVIILRNVTTYKELDFAKTNFIATVSHEFKTPISSIKMSVQILEDEQTGKVNEEQKHLLESIKDDANRLLKITGELLNLTQVESGNVQLNMVPVNPIEILQYAVNANKVQADQKNIKLKVDCPDSLPRVLADSEKTAWVLTNLVSNAIRYSYENAAVLLKVEADDKTLKFSIEDTGQGIAPQYKEKIFDRYFRVPGTKKEGTGLGLAISKEFIEAQGGKITVESDYGAGSVFTVILNKAK